jgi:hypothetical protein
MPGPQYKNWSATNYPMLMPNTATCGFLNLLKDFGPEPIGFMWWSIV